MPPSGAFLLKMKDLLATVVRFVMLFIFSQVSPELLQKESKISEKCPNWVEGQKGLKEK